MDNIKTAFPLPESGGIMVEYWNREPEALKQCLCCDKYHSVDTAVCPETKKFIAKEAQRQAEEGGSLRNLAIRETKAKAAKEKYLLDHGAHRNGVGWRYLTGMIGSMFVYLILTIVFNLVSRGLTIGPWITFVASVIWLVIWMWLDNRHKKFVREQAHDIYRKMMWGKEEVVEAG